MNFTVINNDIRIKSIPTDDEKYVNAQPRIINATLSNDNRRSIQIFFSGIIRSGCDWICWCYYQHMPFDMGMFFREFLAIKNINYILDVWGGECRKLYDSSNLSQKPTIYQIKLFPVLLQITKSQYSTGMLRNIKLLVPWHRRVSFTTYDTEHSVY